MKTKTKPYVDFDEVLEEKLKDPEFKKEWDALAPKYELIQTVKVARLEAGLTQSALAKRVKTKQTNISRLERGQANPSFGFLEKVAKALNQQVHIEFRPLS